MKFPMILLPLVFLGACATPQAPASQEPTTPTRIEVAQRLDKRLTEDPNRELCERIITRVKAGDIDALTPEFDTKSFAERIIATGSLPMQAVDEINAYHDQIPNFTRFHFTEGLNFLCLGTREFLGSDHIVIRNWQPGRFDYLLLHLTDEKKVDDFLVVSAGSYHSELQNLGYNPKYAAASNTIGVMLKKSFYQDFAGILADYKTLPAGLQQEPVACIHFINAAYFGESPGQPNYDKAFLELDTVMAGRVYSIAYWKMADARRRNDQSLDTKYRQLLLELLDDYELLQ